MDASATRNMPHEQPTHKELEIGSQTLSQRQAGYNYEIEDQQDDDQFPNRPRNHGPALPFHTLYQELFDPLLNINKSRIGINHRARYQGHQTKPYEKRDRIINIYFSKWRSMTGDDLHPLIRLILPGQDRHRSMYGLKEKVLAKYIIKVLQIDKKSDDAVSLLDFKKGFAKNAGNFPARAYDVFKKRPHRNEPGDLTVTQVNSMLKRLAAAAKEEEQLPIFEEFYRNMNPEELKWLVSIILRNIHMGATEKTILQVFHPDAVKMFNMCSDLKKVCWDLWSPSIRLDKDDDCPLELGRCFQPQLATFIRQHFDTYPAKLGATPDTPEFWIEEKCDGERIQIHSWIQRTSVKNRYLAEGQEPEYEPQPPYRTFRFYSRNAKDYTYLYGEYLSHPANKNGLTRHFKDAFDPQAESFILDGEMMSWDPATDHVVPFGTLKTAALNAIQNPHNDGEHPFFRPFDCLYLNGKELIRYTLEDRRKALERIIRPVPRRIEILQKTVGTTAQAIEVALRQAVLEGQEGLVVKNPRSRYTLNERNNDWLKVKPEYMQQFGESLDVLIIGGFYGQGKRGGGLSSFLCGLRIDSKSGEPPKQKFQSFLKCGGGFTVQDYATIRHRTDGKWIEWKRDEPPTEYIELGGGARLQKERPDVWIKPEDSVVIEVRAASIGKSDEFAAGITARFPRFKRIRDDRDWKDALSYNEMQNLKYEDDLKQEKERELKLETRKRHQRTDLRKKPLNVVGYSRKSLDQNDVTHQVTPVFQGLTMFIMSDSTKPRKSKAEIEGIVKANGGCVIQTATPGPDDKGSKPPEVICVARSEKLVKVASLVRKEDIVIYTPDWIFDCVAQAKADVQNGRPSLLLRPEFGRHVLHASDERREYFEDQVDKYHDSFARDTSASELRACLEGMDDLKSLDATVDDRLHELMSESLGWLFRGTRVYFWLDLGSSKVDSVIREFLFAGGSIADDIDENITHIAVAGNRFSIQDLRSRIAHLPKLPHIVTAAWIHESWKNKTRLDEERYRP